MNYEQWEFPFNCTFAKISYRAITTCTEHHTDIFIFIFVTKKDFGIVIFRIYDGHEYISCVQPLLKVLNSYFIFTEIFRALFCVRTSSNRESFSVFVWPQRHIVVYCVKLSSFIWVNKGRRILCVLKVVLIFMYLSVCTVFSNTSGLMWSSAKLNTSMAW